MKLLFSLLFVVSVNMMLFLGQTAVDNINPGGPTQFYNYEGSLLEAQDAGGFTLNESITEALPSTASSVSPTTGNIFTDPIATMKNWLLETTGLKYVVSWLNAFPNFIKVIGLPAEVAFALGALWHVLMIAMLVFVLFNRGGS